MTAAIIPFPLNHRRDLIRRQAAWYAQQGANGAEQNLQRQLLVQRQTLLGKGVAPSSVDAQVEALESAIRAEIWRLCLAPGVGA